MSNKANKRVKFKRISREFIIGSEAWPLTEEEKKTKKIQPNATSGWRVYVRPVPGGPCLTAWLKRVTFTLHDTFPNPVRNVENVNPTTGGFELEETAYGGFHIGIKLYFQQYASEKWQQRSHYLQLDPYSFDEDPNKAEEEKERQIRERLVRSEIVEVVEFNEPTELLWDALTSETQLDYLKQPKGKGKNRSSLAGAAASENGSGHFGEPPATAEKGQLWSLEQENLIIEKILQRAADASDKQLEQVLKRAVEVNAALVKLKAGDEIDDSLRTLYESLPPKKK